MKKMHQRTQKKKIYTESLLLYGGPYLAEDFPPFLPLTLASSSFTGVAPSPPNAACSAASLASLSSSSAFNSSYSFLQFKFVTKLKLNFTSSFLSYLELNFITLGPFILHTKNYDWVSSTNLCIYQKIIEYQI